MGRAPIELVEISVVWSVSGRLASKLAATVLVD
jgi:hypothetical protein